MNRNQLRWAKLLGLCGLAGLSAVALEAQACAAGEPAVVLVSALRVRSGPQLDAAIRGRLPRGTQVCIRGTVGDWAEVRSMRPAIGGFVARGFLGDASARLEAVAAAQPALDLTARLKATLRDLLISQEAHFRGHNRYATALVAGSTPGSVDSLTLIVSLDPDLAVEVVEPRERSFGLLLVSTIDPGITCGIRTGTLEDERLMRQIEAIPECW